MHNKYITDVKYSIVYAITIHGCICVWLFFLHVCLRITFMSGAKRGCWISWPGITEGYELPWRCGKLNQHLLEEQPMFLTAEPSLQPLCSICINLNNLCFIEIMNFNLDFKSCELLIQALWRQKQREADLCEFQESQSPYLKNKQKIMSLNLISILDILESIIKADFLLWLLLSSSPLLKVHIFWHFFLSLFKESTFSFIKTYFISLNSFFSGCFNHIFSLSYILTSSFIRFLSYIYNLFLVILIL